MKGLDLGGRDLSRGNFPSTYAIKSIGLGTGN